MSERGPAPIRVLVTAALVALVLGVAAVALPGAALPSLAYSFLGIGVAVAALSLTGAVDRARAARVRRTTDLTTGLPSRARLEAELSDLLAASHGDLAVLVLDVDRFSEINATVGHDVGDEVLRAIGRRVADVFPDERVRRLGGDEFCVLLPGLDAARAMQRARDLRRALGRPVEAAGLRLPVTASIGVSVAPNDGVEPGLLLRRGDVALAAAKQDRSRIARFDAAVEARTVLGGSLARELHEAIDRGQMRLHLQPIVDTVSRRVVSVEALVRWQHPEHGLLSPEAFVPAAERTGSIVPLTRWVLDAALAAVAGARADGSDLRVNVNLSAQSLRDHHVVHDVRRALRSHRVPGTALVVEITETSAMTDPARADDVLRALSDLGVGISLDDYGTGYSSLAHLQRMPVDELKIDRSFVSRITEHGPSEAIVRSTIELGHRLGLTVVAEGVEDQAAVAMLDAMGCRFAQGFALSRPVPAEDLAAALARARMAARSWPALRTVTGLVRPSLPAAG